jgi:GNAT superfamily N-acetyltransferase
MGVIFVCEHVAFPSVEAWDRGVEAQHEIVGFIAAVVGVDPFSGQEYADEVAWFVAPDHRHGTAGVRLVEALESWARDKRLGFAKMVAPGEAGSRVAGFLTRRGYHVIETSMIKRL